MAPECDHDDCDQPADIRAVVYDHRDPQMRIYRDFCVEHILNAYFN